MFRMFCSSLNANLINLIRYLNVEGCSQEEFTCGNGQCVPNYRKCDGRRDCSDGSDESYAVCQPSKLFVVFI